MSIQLFLLILAISWFGLMAVMLLNSEGNEDRFRIASFLSLGMLGLLFRERQHSEVSRRERIGLSILIVMMMLVVVATLLGLI